MYKQVSTPLSQERASIKMLCNVIRLSWGGGTKKQLTAQKQEIVGTLFQAQSTKCKTLKFTLKLQLG